MQPTLVQLVEDYRREDSRVVKVMTFGASESHFSYHSNARPTWYHWLEKTWRTQSPHIIMMNGSIGGNCVRDLWGRFDRYVTPFRPDMVFISMGGNDANVPVPMSEFYETLTNLCKRVQALGGTPVLQTLYTPVLHRFSEAYQRTFPDYMVMNLTVADECGVPCLDMHRWFYPAYQADPERYARELMTDDIHVNEVGNAVWGCLVAEEMGLPKPALADLEEDVDRSLAWLRSLTGKK